MHPASDDDMYTPDSLDLREISDIGDTLILGNTDRSIEEDTVIQDRVIQDRVIQDPSEPEKSADKSNPVSQISVEQWLESLRRTDRTFYNMMAMEVWAIAKSMDTLLPGFWSKFMANRQIAVQNFVVQRRSEKGTGLRLEDLGHPNPSDQN